MSVRGSSGDVFWFRNAKSSVFSRRRKTHEERLRSGRHDPYRIVQSPHTPVGRRLAPAAFVRNLSSPPLCKGRWCEAPEGLLQNHGTTPQMPPGCFSFSLAKSSVFSRRRKTPRDAARLVQLTPCTGEPKDAQTLQGSGLSADRGTPSCVPFSSRSCFHPTAASKFRNRIPTNDAPKFKNATLYG